MPCYHPLRAWRGKLLPSGKRAVVFKRGESTPALLPFPLDLPCGQCIGCRLERSRQWALRCWHEASLYEENCFITLTYDDDHVPLNGSLDVREFQLFMKRLRKEFSDRKVRYFHCGEYGEDFGRPHYHACLFNFDFADKVYWNQNGRGDRWFRSATLEKLWPFGFSMIGDVTFESAAYVARYVMKKVYGEEAPAHYVNKSTGEVLTPEYTTMSRRPGIGRGFFDKFKLDMYPHDFVVCRGIRMKPPKFYDGCLESEAPDVVGRIKASRVSRCSRFVHDNIDGRDVLVSDSDCFRLAVKEEVKLSQIAQLSRKLESGQ